jgi:hypothetical protein
MEWIDIKNQTPLDCELVLLYTPWFLGRSRDCWVVAQWDENANEFVVDWDAELFPDAPTHWHPLTSPHSPGRSEHSTSTSGRGGGEGGQ